MQECIQDHATDLKSIGSKIVADDAILIQKAIREALSEHGSAINLILTSGGTGFTPNDVTPEAVSNILKRRADSLN